MKCPSCDKQMTYNYDVVVPQGDKSYEDRFLVFRCDNCKGNIPFKGETDVPIEIKRC